MAGNVAHGRAADEPGIGGTMGQIVVLRRVGPKLAAGHSVNPDQWLAGMDDLLALTAGHVVRGESRSRLRQFVFAMMAGLPRTNCWSIAEHAGERCPRGRQRFLSEAVWDQDAVLDDVRGWVIAHLGDPDAVLVIDETGDVKKGHQGLSPACPGVRMTAGPSPNHSLLIRSCAPDEPLVEEIN